MATAARFRSGALALPESAEGTHFGAVAFFVGGKGFASLSKDGQTAQFRLPAEQVAAATAEHDAIEPVTRDGRPIGVSVPLTELDVRLLRQAWEAAAPRRLVAAHDPASARARAALPAIGRPATDALLQAGISTLDDVARRTEAELLQLHGVGPKAIRILRDALAADDRTFRAG